MGNPKLWGRRQQLPWGVGTQKVPWASGHLEIQSVTLSLRLSALLNVCKWKNPAYKALKWSGDSRALWRVLNTQEKDGVKNRVDREPSAPGSPEKLVYKFIKGFQEPFLGVDVRT